MRLKKTTRGKWADVIFLMHNLSNCLHFYIKSGFILGTRYQDAQNVNIKASINLFTDNLLNYLLCLFKNGKCPIFTTIIYICILITYQNEYIIVGRYGNQREKIHNQSANVDTFTYNNARAGQGLQEYHWRSHTVPKIGL